jgi:hypothetical protein
MNGEAERDAGRELTLDEELLLWLGDEPPAACERQRAHANRHKRRTA